MNNASSLIEVAYSETYLPKDAVDNLEMALSEGRARPRFTFVPLAVSNSNSNPVPANALRPPVK